MTDPILIFSLPPLDIMTDIIDHLLQYKNGQESSAQLEKELEDSIKTTLSNYKYR